MRATSLLASAALAAAVFAGCKKGQEETQQPEATQPATDEDTTEMDTETEPEPPAAGDQPVAATADLASRSGSDAGGTVTFTETDGAVRVQGEITGLEPGDHGFHVHETGDCSGQQAKTAGGHFNPTDAKHGGPQDAEHHVGDMGNITAGEDGTATIDETFDYLSLEEGAQSSILGRALMVHGGADDLESQPSGDAGARVACGVIQLASEGAGPGDTGAGAAAGGGAGAGDEAAAGGGAGAGGETASDAAP